MPTEVIRACSCWSTNRELSIATRRGHICLRRIRFATCSAEGLNRTTIAPGTMSSPRKGRSEYAERLTSRTGQPGVPMPGQIRAAALGSPQGDVFQRLERALARRLARFDSGAKFYTLMLSIVVLKQASKRRKQIQRSSSRVRL